MTQNYRNLKMYNQNNRFSDTPKALLSLYLIILTSCFGLFIKYIHRYRTAFSLFAERCFEIMKLKNPLTVSPNIYIPRTVTEDAREQIYQETLVFIG